jgi:hypothetical protein
MNEYLGYVTGYENEYKEFKMEFKFCQCIITRGKRVGKRCYEYANIDCGHKLQTLNIIKKEKESIKLIGKRHPCRARVKKEIGHGYEKCGRINCKFHYIVSDILNLPDTFLEYENLYNQSHTEKYSSKELIEMYEYSYEKTDFEKYKIKFCKFLKKFINKFETFSCMRQKYFLFSYIIHLAADTPSGRLLMNENQRFKNVVLNKINDCLTMEITNDNCILVTYIQATFTSNPDKKYLTKAKNTKHNIFLFKMMVKLLITYQNTLKYTYMPGGKMFIEAKKDFYKNASLASNF